jgi:hypothetical protein
MSMFGSGTRNTVYYSVISFVVIRSYSSTRDAPDIRPDNPAFFDIRFPAGY